MTEYHLHTPLSDADVEKLVAGDVVFLSGPLFTARDKAHALMRRVGCPVSLAGSSPLSLRSTHLGQPGSIRRADHQRPHGPLHG